jgi:hypothetical protein
MGSALARAKSEGDPSVLDDDQAFGLGGINNMTQPEGSKEESQPESQTDHVLQATHDMSIGHKLGTKAMKKPSTTAPKGPKPGESLNKDEKKFAQQIKKLEIRYMLFVKAQKRMLKAKEYHDQTETRYTEAHKLYEKIDEARKNENHTPEMIDQATRDAGDARLKVAQSAVYLEKMRAFKQEVYRESQTYKDYVGERAMASWKRKLKKTVGMVGGAGLRALTGGMYRIEAEDEAGGYRVALKGRTILDDVVRKYYELKQILRGVNGKPVRGLGGKHGARAYVFFKSLSFALQIIRDISSAVALWVTIVTGGTGAPVGAVFASIALYSGLSKAAIDLLLLIWSAVGLANTNDPVSRMILRGENTRQGLAFGEGAFIGASAGLTMGLSGQTGLLSGQMQTTPFGEGSKLHGSISDNWSQNIGGKELYYGSMLRTGANLGVGPAVPALGNIGQNVGVNVASPYRGHANMTTERFSAQAEKVRKAKGAIRLVANPARAAFLGLSKFAQSKKKVSKSKFMEILPELSKTIEEMGSTVDEVPESAPSESPESESEQSESQPSQSQPSQSE